MQLVCNMNGPRVPVRRKAVDLRDLSCNGLQYLSPSPTRCSEFDRGRSPVTTRGSAEVVLLENDRPQGPLHADSTMTRRCDDDRLRRISFAATAWHRGFCCTRPSIFCGRVTKETAKSPRRAAGHGADGSAPALCLYLSALPSSNAIASECSIAARAAWNEVSKRRLGIISRKL
jgi:hypothetical protein